MDTLQGRSWSPCSQPASPRSPAWSAPEQRSSDCGEWAVTLTILRFDQSGCGQVPSTRLRALSRHLIEVFCLQKQNLSKIMQCLTTSEFRIDFLPIAGRRRYGIDMNFFLHKLCTKGYWTDDRIMFSFCFLRLDNFTCCSCSFCFSIMKHPLCNIKCDYVTNCGVWGDSSATYFIYIFTNLHSFTYFCLIGSFSQTGSVHQLILQKRINRHTVGLSATIDPQTGAAETLCETFGHQWYFAFFKYFLPPCCQKEQNKRLGVKKMEGVKIG